METRKLNVNEHRTKEESKVTGEACQCFHLEGVERFPGFISGAMTLPPKGIKDSEATGYCNQVFTVVDCQPGALEVAFGNEEDGNMDPEKAQRFLLSPRDMVRVPAGNCYRLENHSKKKEAYVTWVIMRPFQDD